MTIKDKINALPSKGDLAKKAGISRAMLSHWLAGRKNVSVATEKRIEEAFNELMKEILAQPGEVKFIPVEDASFDAPKPDTLHDEAGMVSGKYKLLVRGDDYKQISNGILYSKKEDNFMAEVPNGRGSKESKVFWTEREARDWRIEQLKKLI